MQKLKLLFITILLFYSHQYTSIPACTINIKEMHFVHKIKAKAFYHLKNEVDSYLKIATPDSKISSRLLINKCIEYKIDIAFVIAQGIIESHMGTKGKATITNSVWNVGSFDNGVSICLYDDPNNSIEPYLNLLKRKYIKKDHNCLLDSYINKNGHRYATADNYEDYLKKVMNKINFRTNIKYYQNILQMSDKDILINFGFNFLI